MIHPTFTQLDPLYPKRNPLLKNICSDIEELDVYLLRRKEGVFLPEMFATQAPTVGNEFSLIIGGAESLIDRTFKFPSWVIINE